MASLLAASLASCSSCTRTHAPPPTTAAAQQGTVTFSPTGKRAIAVRVEIMRSALQRARGLMFREQLGARDGMLFVFEDQRVHSFWMKNTHIPLDIIFIDEGLAVVGVVHNARPRSTEPLSVAAPSRYVVEVNAGFASANGIDTGTRVDLPQQ